MPAAHTHTQCGGVSQGRSVWDVFGAEVFEAWSLAVRVLIICQQQVEGGEGRRLGEQHRLNLLAHDALCPLDLGKRLWADGGGCGSLG